MESIEQFTAFLNTELKVNKIKDSSRNGLQVPIYNSNYNSNRRITKITRVGFAVDACLTTFEKAKKANVELLIVHHGLLWKGKRLSPEQKRLKRKRIGFLKNSRIALYAAHLPLDMHTKYGNNICLARILRLKNIKKFGYYKGQSIGYSGAFQKPTTLNALAKILNKRLRTRCTIIAFKNKKNKPTTPIISMKPIKTVCIISGRGTSCIPEAARKRFDCFITGEIDHDAAVRSRDAGLSIIIAGHYATETLGVKALMPLLKQKFNIQTVFINDSTNL